MNLRNVFWMIAVVVYGNVGIAWGYEGGPAGGTAADPCGGAMFSQFHPQPFSQEKNSVDVAPHSEFSFLASKGTFPKSIAVSIKGETVPIEVTPHFAGFQVAGNLPGNIKGTFVRINISAKGPYECERGDGWLLKVADK